MLEQEPVFTRSLTTKIRYVCCYLGHCVRRGTVVVHVCASSWCCSFGVGR